MNAALLARIDRIQRWLLLAGLVVLAAAFSGAFFRRGQFFFSYLFGYLFWLGLSLGCFVVFMIHQLTGGRWGHPTRRFLEAGFMSLPMMTVLIVPIFFGLSELYPWARPSDVLADPILQERRPYENPALFIVRSVLFLGIASSIAWLLRRWSLRQDLTPDATATRRARALSGPGLIISTFLGTFAAVDWIMSLETKWHSSIFGIVVLSGQVLTAFAFAVLMLSFVRRHEPFARIVSSKHDQQLGNLLLTFVLFWTYVSFGEFLIVYSGDLPREIDWYLHRVAGTWKWIFVLMVLLHFLLPFFLLLFRSIKKDALALALLAAAILFAHLLNTYWLVMPAFHTTGLAISWLDTAAPLGIGALWLSSFLARLKAAPVVPQQDPGSQFAFDSQP